MQLQTVQKLIKSIPPGRFFRIEYKTQVLVKKQYKDSVTITKVTEMTTRTGINYASVADKYIELPSDRIASYKPWRWNIYRKIKYNTEKDKYYLVVAPIKKGNNATTYYQVSYNGIMYLVEDLSEMFEEYVRPSYFKKSETGGKVININIENILSINGEYE